MGEDEKHTYMSSTLVDSICVKVFVMNAPILRSAPPPATDRLACIGRVRQWGSQFRGNGYNQDADQDRQPFDSFSHNASSGLGVLDVFFFFDQPEVCRSSLL